MPKKKPINLHNPPPPAAAIAVNNYPDEKDKRMLKNTDRHTRYCIDSNLLHVPLDINVKQKTLKYINKI